MSDNDVTQQIPFPEPPTDAPLPPRPVKIAHLVMGLFFLGFVAMATSLDTGTIAWSGARYLWPTLLVGVGLVGLLATLASNRRRVRRPGTLPD
ncbi:MAG: hypothetical protein ACTHJM_00205 [Marmoricola sp.]